MCNVPSGRPGESIPTQKQMTVLRTLYNLGEEFSSRACMLFAIVTLHKQSMANLTCEYRSTDMKALQTLVDKERLRQPITEDMQKDAYLGNNSPLLAHMSQKALNTMSTIAVRQWFEDHPNSFPDSYLKAGYHLKTCQIDHILPRSIGGVDHPLNYFILPTEINRRWSGWWTREKRAYMGQSNFEKFSHFVLWTRKQAERCGVQYNDFVS